MVVRVLVFGIDFAPIAGQVLLQEELERLAALGRGIEGTRRGDDLARFEFGVHDVLLCAGHFPPASKSGAGERPRSGLGATIR